jgi:flagellar basal body rod protein FlgG
MRNVRSIDLASARHGAQSRTQPWRIAKPPPRRKADPANLRGDGSVETSNGLVGRLQVVRFANPAGLEKIGHGLIRTLPQAQPEPEEDLRIAVGFVEGANVSLAAEMAAMIQTARSFEVATKSPRAHDELTQSLLEVNR